MRKTLIDVADYLKEIMVPETNEDYSIKPEYTNYFDDDHFYEGIRSFRVFLARLYEVLKTKGLGYDTSKKIAHAYENRTTLSVYYPFLHHVKSLLIKIGYHGVPIEKNSFDVSGNMIFSEKLSVTKTLECLHFLSACGIVFDGLELKDKKQNLLALKNLKVSYPDDSRMLIGLKVMAIAEIDHGTLINQDVFLRCDYRVLKKEAVTVLPILQDTIKPLAIDVQEFILQLHQRYIEKGMACVVEVKGFHIYVKYSYKRKDIWGVNASLNNGYHINVKATKTNEYADTIQAFSPSLQEEITKGYGCGRKRGLGHCNGGCRGIPIPLNESILDLRDDIFTWFDQELKCLKEKK